MRITRGHQYYMRNTFYLFQVMLVLLFIMVVFGASMPIMPHMEVPQIRNQTHNMRTYFDIVWSCLSTLFICTWVAIHPNIPPHGEGHIQSFWRKVKIIMRMLVVPELILIWAYRQWSTAGLITEYFQAEGWTMKHGHFLIMGGFTYFDGEVESVLDFNQFCRLLGSDNRTPEISFPTITAEEIQDKTRGDFLSKAIVVLQSLWFIVHCSARGIQGIALTELEVVTLALASLNGGMYYFWWDKPLGVKEPIKLYRKGKEPAEKIIGDWQERNVRIQTSSQGSLVRRLVLCPFQRLYSSLAQVLEDFKIGCRTQVFTTYHWLSSISPTAINKSLDNQRKKLNLPADTYLWFVYLPIKWAFFDPIVALSNSLFATATTGTLKSRAVHVPTFYAPRMDSSVKSDDLLLFVLPPIAVVFGALHCIAWNFHFPSHNERLLWRIGSLMITLILAVPPVVFFMLFLFFDLLPSLFKSFCGIRPSIIRFPKTMRKMLTTILVGLGAFLAGAGLVAYMVARLLLLAQAIILLRRQPESAFYAINWADFFPHI